MTPHTALAFFVMFVTGIIVGLLAWIIPTALG